MKIQDGRLISIEGINCAGKSTQATLLRSALQQQGYKVKSINFPRNETKVGTLIHNILCGHCEANMYLLFALFSVNRLESRDAIVECLSSGRIVVADRYSESEYAYGMAKGLPEHWLLSLESKMPRADVVILLDIEPSIALTRVDKNKERDIFEEDLSFLSKVRQCYLELANRPRWPDQRWEIVDAGQTIQMVHETVAEIVSQVLAIKTN